MEGIITKIQRFCIQDGPGIRTTVFLKGCPLRCLWCSNPETQNPLPELTYNQLRCLEDCNECILHCKYGALIKENGKVLLDKSLCKNCFECAKVCPSGALSTVGEWKSAEEIIEEISKDLPFYKKSGGGITLSGGEPLLQVEFAREIFELCDDIGIHRALDTSGFAKWKDFRKILDCVDLILYDIKHMDSEKHEELTGVSNKIILENAKRLSEEEAPMIIRVPIIPTINDSEENLKSLATFVKSLNAIQVELLPYHRLGVSKYEMIWRDYSLKTIETPSSSHMENIKSFLTSFGLKVVIRK